MEDDVPFQLGDRYRFQPIIFQGVPKIKGDVFLFIACFFLHVSRTIDTGIQGIETL